MTRDDMLNISRRLVNQLDSLEAILAQIPQSQHAFIFSSEREARELWQIANYETETRATPEQAAHLNRLTNRLNTLLGALPAVVRKQIKKGP